MIGVEHQSITYFKAPKDYFWQWAEKGAILEWPNGTTICYRDDLVDVLQQLQNRILPELSPLLLLLSACKGTFGTQEVFHLSKNLSAFNNGQNEAESEQLKNTLDEALSFFKIIASFPENLRTGKKKVHLIQEIFKDVTIKIANWQVQDALMELRSGRFDKNIFTFFGNAITENAYNSHLSYFSNALKKYPTVQHLIIKLRTGLDHLPEAMDISLPEDNRNIFDQLLQDPATAGMASLAKRLVATLNIPMQSKGSSDQPLGGISDITNRGNYDKLLLSELAYDDELLMARLVNNEALYFKKEQPPEKPKLKRIILIDTTLKMWGTSRVFALAAGLASAQPNKHAQLLQAYCLGGTIYTPVNLTAKAGIIQALGMLDHALHCGKSLEAVIQSILADVKNELIFITDAKLLQSPAFHTSLSIVRKSLSFIITVSNTGELCLYEYTNGISKQIGSANISIDELLSNPVVYSKKRKQDNKNTGLPLFLSFAPSPLYYSPIRIKISPEKTFVKEQFGALIINENQRVLFVNQCRNGVFEILNFIENGVYTLGVISNNSLCILVSNLQRSLLKLYIIDNQNFESKTVDFNETVSFFTRAIFKYNFLYLQTNKDIVVYDCIAGIVIDKKELLEIPNIFDEPKKSIVELRKLIADPIYNIEHGSIFYKVQGIYINTNNQLVVGNHVLMLQQKLHFSFDQQKPEKDPRILATLLEEPLYLVQNKSIKFNKWVWKDGSEAIIDSRGMLHLKSSNKALPEITIVLIINQTSACWASDGVSAGATYFINENITRKIPADEFYNLYIHEYINHLM